MAEEVKSPNPPMTFKSSFWGFNRDEVLNCIDALAAKAREEEQQHRDQLAALQEQIAQGSRQLADSQAENQELTQKLAQSESRAQEAQEQAEELSRKLLKANNKRTASAPACMPKSRRPWPCRAATAALPSW